ncbi:ribosomal protein L1-like protein [Trypanosoma rangeli]|uniref:Ribosomal protein L1-like protein n=1 Tax=Trypanosoma rangeli TaxID=5698 RepID=A0A422NVW5_TRYRA|nr:ribosomal protein L1-like protein [Trypanosoma rangeli]RNF09605.1 ribosomal protein L1-like protein [Trypanosoma rangeli]|eukprot:RNF09605.1 ribosomal protein L1-like protein [Trypanosoma rangeli]
MMDTPRSKEALTKLCSFLSSDPGSAREKDVLGNLFSSSPETHFRGVEVEVAFLRAPAAHRVPLYFTLPQEVLPGTICVVTPPPQRKYKDKVLRLSEDGNAVAQRVKKVIDTQKLAMKFVDPVTVRALANSFDHFVLIGVKKYPFQLTGEFLGHQKPPVWMPLRGGLKETLLRAVKTVVFQRRGNSAITCSIGHTGLSLEQLHDNLQSLLAQMTSHVQAITPQDILHIRVAGTNAEGRRAGLPIFAHTFQIPREMPRDCSEEPKTKKLKECK